MNAVHLEALVYALQIASFFLVAAPVMLRTERQRTLSANPGWLATQPELLRAQREPSLQPFRVATVVLLLLLAGAALVGSRPLLFGVHTLLFFLTCVGFYAYYDRAEKQLRQSIPEDPVRRAALQPRRFSAFVPAWATWSLGAAAVGVLALNAWGYGSQRIEPGRALGNVAFLVGLGALLGLLARHTWQRAAYRMSGATDASGRSLELSLTLGVAGFFTAIALYQSLGSIGPEPLFPFPPTTLHGLFEDVPFSYALFFERAEYRWVEVATALFIAALGPWLARAPFTRRVLAADPAKVQSSFEI